MKERVIDICAIAGMSGILIGLCMMVGTQTYLNRSPRRSRFIELIWGTNNAWYSGKRFDFAEANLIIPGSTFTAWRMSKGLITRTQRRVGAFANPYLHHHHNYTKLLNEFSAFVAWEALKASIIFASLSLLALGMGLDKGWF